MRISARRGSRGDLGLPVASPEAARLRRGAGGGRTGGRRQGGSEQPDIILLDMNLPIIDGWTAASMIKADVETAHMPIIALTAHAMSGDREKAIAAGCDDYHPKPVDFSRLLAQIEALGEQGAPGLDGTGAGRTARPIAARARPASRPHLGHPPRPARRGPPSGPSCARCRPIRSVTPPQPATPDCLFAQPAATAPAGPSASRAAPRCWIDAAVGARNRPRSPAWSGTPQPLKAPRPRPLREVRVGRERVVRLRHLGLDHREASRPCRPRRADIR